MSAPWDLSSLFGAPPPGSAQDVRYRQGTIVTWDPLTLSNTIDVGGATLTDVPVLGVAEAATYAAGDVVGLMVIGSRGGGATWAIIGQLVRPNTAQAFSALSYLSSRIFASFVETGESTASAVFTDLATFGPSVPVLVGASGSIVVIIGAQIQSNLDDVAWGGDATIEMSGANTLAAATAANTQRLKLEWGETGAGTMFVSTTPMAAVRWDGLNPGMTTITVKYRRTSGAVNVDFFRRSLIVFAL